jgi:hypothetical protein
MNNEAKRVKFAYWRHSPDWDGWDQGKAQIVGLHDNQGQFELTVRLFENRALYLAMVDQIPEKVHREFMDKLIKQRLVHLCGCTNELVLRTDFIDSIKNGADGMVDLPLPVTDRNMRLVPYLCFIPYEKKGLRYKTAVEALAELNCKFAAHKDWLPQSYLNRKKWKEEAASSVSAATRSKINNN